MLNQRRLIPSTSMLLAFDASVRNGSFTEAAQELNLSPGAISRQVRALEDQLNVKLFKRIRKSIQLTDTGKIYAQEIGTALKAIQNASLKVVNDPQGGILNLAILPTFGMRWLMPRFPDFLNKYPQITVNFASKLSPFDFSNENLHGAIHFGLPDWPETNISFFMKEEVVPVASPSLVAKKLPLTAQDLSKLPLLHVETRPNAWGDWFNQNDYNIKLLKGMVFEQFALVTQAAVASLGAALLPRFMINTELQRGELVVLVERPLESKSGYYLVTPEHYSCYAPIVALREWLLKQTHN